MWAEDIHVDKILHWLNRVQEASSWAKWTTFIYTVAREGVWWEVEEGREWGGQFCSGEILGRSDQAIYSNISWKEHAVLALSAELIYSSLVILRWAVSGKEFPISLAFQVSHKAIISFFPHEQWIHFLYKLWGLPSYLLVFFSACQDGQIVYMSVGLNLDSTLDGFLYFLINPFD